jgi:hypothetical protein
VEVLVICSIELVQTIEHVLARMRMYDVQQHAYAHRVCGIDQFFEFFGSTISGTSSEKAGDLITKGYREERCQYICRKYAEDRNFGLNSHA